MPGCGSRCTRPASGYYSAGATKLGGGGDFVTAPEISSLFSRCLARQCADVLRDTGGDVLELGAGSGRMAADMLTELAALECAAGAIPHPRSQRGSRRAPARAPRAAAAEFVRARAVVRPLAGAEHARRGAGQRSARRDARGTVRAARPAGRHRRARARRRAHGERIRMARDVAERRSSCTPWPTSSRRCRRRCPTVTCRRSAWRSSRGWRASRGSWKRASRCSSTTACRARTSTIPDRATGTLRCHFRHRAHSDPFINVGLQDITAWVDFTRVAEAADSAGLEVLGFATPGRVPHRRRHGVAADHRDAARGRRCARAGEARRRSAPAPAARRDGRDLQGHRARARISSRRSRDSARRRWRCSGLCGDLVPAARQRFRPVRQTTFSAALHLRYLLGHVPRKPDRLSSSIVSACCAAALGIACNADRAYFPTGYRAWTITKFRVIGPESGSSNRKVACVTITRTSKALASWGRFRDGFGDRRRTRAPEAR